MVKHSTITLCLVVVLALNSVALMVYGQEESCDGQSGKEAIETGIKIVREVKEGTSSAVSCRIAIECFNMAVDKLSLSDSDNIRVSRQAAFCYEKLGDWKKSLEKLRIAGSWADPELRAEIVNEWIQVADKVASEADDLETCEELEKAADNFKLGKKSLFLSVVATCYENNDWRKAIITWKKALESVDSGDWSSVSEIIKEYRSFIVLLLNDESKFLGDDTCPLAEWVLENKPEAKERELAQSVIKSRCEKVPESVVVLSEGKFSIDDELPEEETSRVTRSGPSKLGPILFLVAGAGATVAGIITGVLALSAQDDLKQICPDRKCQESKLEEAESKADEIKTLSKASDGLFIGAGVTVLVGLLWITNQKDSDSKYAFGASVTKEKDFKSFIQGRF